MKYCILVIAVLLSSNQSSASVLMSAMLDKPRLIVDIANNSLSEDERFLSRNIHCGLFRRGRLGKIEGDLVKNWEVKNGGRLFEFELKNNIFDSGGRLITPYDVRNSILNALSGSNSSGKDFAGLGAISGFQSCRKGGICKGLRAQGAKLIVELSQNWPNFIESIVRELLPVTRIESGRLITCGDYEVTQNDLAMLKLKSRKPDAGGVDEIRIKFLKPVDAYKEFCRGALTDLLFYMPTAVELASNGCVPGSYSYKNVDTAGFWLVHLNPKTLPSRGAGRRLLQQIDLSSMRRLWWPEGGDQTTLIPNYFGVIDPGSPSWQSGVRAVPGNGADLKVRYIRGTPHSDRLQMALKSWLGEGATIAATDFTDFVVDLQRLSSDVYIYAETSPSGNLSTFLSAIVSANLSGASRPVQRRIEGAWKAYLMDQSTKSLELLNMSLMEGGAFLPLKVLTRPIVTQSNVAVRRYSDLGLSDLSLLDVEIKK